MMTKALFWCVTAILWLHGYRPAKLEALRFMASAAYSRGYLDLLRDLEQAIEHEESRAR
jgi:hypothetical protein